MTLFISGKWNKYTYSSPSVRQIQSMCYITPDHQPQESILKGPKITKMPTYGDHSALLWKDSVLLSQAPQALFTSRRPHIRQDSGCDPAMISKVTVSSFFSVRDTNIWPAHQVMHPSLHRREVIWPKESWVSFIRISQCYICHWKQTKIQLNKFSVKSAGNECLPTTRM